MRALKEEPTALNVKVLTLTFTISILNGKPVSIQMAFANQFLKRLAYVASYSFMNDYG